MLSRAARHRLVVRTGSLRQPRGSSPLPTLDSNGKDFTMRQIFGYFCWCRQVSLASVASATRHELHILGSNRPPTHKAGLLAFSADEKGPDEMDDDLDKGATMSAMPSLNLSWAADMLFPGNPALGILDYKVIRGDRDKALNWIHSEPGQDWLKDAEQYFLMCFGINGPMYFDPNSFEAVKPPKRPDGFMAYAGPWDKEFKRQMHRKSHYTERAWRRLNIGGYLADAVASVQCERVAAAMKLWKGDQAKWAKEEHLSAWHAVMPVFKAAGHPDPFGTRKTHAIELAGRLFEEVRAPLAYFKDVFDLARPEGTSVCGSLTPHLASPEHPSYPSGHAAWVWLIAHALGSHPALKCKADAMKAVANDVAYRRVIAGLHFPIDADAGKALAEGLFGLINDRSTNKRFDEFQALWDKAANELK
jgi:PAP2 superfamily